VVAYGNKPPISLFFFFNVMNIKMGMTEKIRFKALYFGFLHSLLQPETETIILKDLTSIAKAKHLRKKSIYKNTFKGLFLILKVIAKRIQCFTT
jgi:hypothetical protein